MFNTLNFILVDVVFFKKTFLQHYLYVYKNTHNKSKNL